MLIFYLAADEKRENNGLPNGRSSVLDGVRTTGSEGRGLEPRRNPVADVSASDIMPGSSSISELPRESMADAVITFNEGSISTTLLVS